MPPAKKRKHKHVVSNEVGGDFQGHALGWIKETGPLLGLTSFKRMSLALVS
jgi:hypothetical protein